MPLGILNIIIKCYTGMYCHVYRDSSNSTYPTTKLTIV